MPGRVERSLGFIEAFGQHLPVAHNHAAHFPRAGLRIPQARLPQSQPHKPLVLLQSVRQIAYLVAVLFAIPPLLRAGIGAQTSEAIRTVELDPQNCYRVRELQFTRGDVQFSFSDGYLIFSRPVLDAPIAAVFSAAVEGGDGEVLLMPPDRDERRTLSLRAGNPNLEAHLRDAAFFFADNTAAELGRQIEASEWMHKDPEHGALLAARYTPVLRHVVPQFETRLQLDLLTRPHQPSAYFAALVSPRPTAGADAPGNFDIVFDSRATEQILTGQGTPDGFKVWTSYTPRSLRNAPLSSDFLASQYRIDSRLDAQLHMRVETTITLTGLTRDLNAISFDLSRQMRVISAEIDGHPAEIADPFNVIDPGADPGDRLFLLVPAEPLRAAATHSVKILHEGDVITADPHHVYFVGSRGRWYPHRSLEFARFDLKFRFPKALDLVAPGDSVLNTVEGDERVIERRIDTPIPMAGFNLGNYSRTVVKRGDFSVEMCANRDDAYELHADLLPPPHAFSGPGEGIRTPLDSEASAPDPRARFAALADDIADVMEFYSRHFGPPPLRRLIVSPIPGRFGQGFGGLIYLSTMAYMSPSGKAFADLDAQHKIFFTELMHAHEVAHQWWGNLVLTAGYHDEWITEALANYSAMLYIEKRYGPKPVNTLLESYREGLLDTNAAGVAVEQSGPVTDGRRLELDGKPAAWITVMYGKGTWIMRMLHARMGDEAFWKMLAELRHRYERKNLTTDQFRELCAEFMPTGVPDPKLRDFFDQWVYGMGIPALKLTASGKNLRAAGTLTQKDVPDDFSADFPVQIDLHGRKITTWVRSSSEPVSFSIPVPTRPERIELDPGNQFLKR